MITIDDLKRRMAQLETERTQAIAHIQAITGALQDCQYWLDVLEKAVGAESYRPSG